MERLGGFHGVQVVITEVPHRKTVRVEAFCDRLADAQSISSAFGGSVRAVKHQNWAAMAPEPSQPILVRKTLVVVDADTPKKVTAAVKQFPDRQVVAIPPELAFGTGHHATTETVLGFIADEAARHQKAETPWTVCDLGCGSGILGIAARKLGASTVWGCDYDGLAIKVAKDNIQRNHTDKTSFVKADLLKWQPRKQWDLVVANIFFDVLIESYPTIVTALKPQGTLIVSGILKAHAPECLAAAEANGIIWKKKVTKKNKWVSALGHLKG
jgi:ribosomal protein L11 methyltransferase